MDPQYPNTEVQHKSKLPRILLIVLVVIIAAAVAATIYFDWGKIFRSSGKLASPFGEEYHSIKLDVSAPFSTAVLIIYKDGSVYYEEEGEGYPRQIKTKEPDFISRSRLEYLWRAFETENYFQLTELKHRGLRPEDGSNYTITVTKELIGGEEVEVHSVTCYEFSCPSNFSTIKKRIEDTWARDILEIGV